MKVITLNTQTAADQELDIVFEWNPHYRGRRWWRLWSWLTPYLIINKWRASARLQGPR